MKFFEVIVEAPPRVYYKKIRRVPSASAPTVPEVPVSTTRTPQVKTISKPQTTPVTPAVPEKQRLNQLNNLFDEYEKQFASMKTDILPKLMDKAKSISTVSRAEIPQNLLEPVDHEFYFNRKKSMLDYYEKTMAAYKQKVEGLKNFIRYYRRYIRPETI